jgi:hypothetical protein
MSANAEQPKWKTWTGRVLSALPVIFMTMSGIMKLTHGPKVVEGFGQFGYAEHLLTPIGVVELLCVVLYVVPQTAVLGAILMVGYLGGATATHARMSDPMLVSPVILGIIAWLGIWLREPRLRALTPLRK